MLHASRLLFHPSSELGTKCPHSRLARDVLSLNFDKMKLEDFNLLNFSLQFLSLDHLHIYGNQKHRSQFEKPPVVAPQRGKSPNPRPVGSSPQYCSRPTYDSKKPPKNST